MNNEWHKNYMREYRKVDNNRYIVKLRKTRVDVKKILSDSLGGKCNRCNWMPDNELELVALEFHHLDRSTKSFNISTGSTRKLSILLAEVKKCQLLCSRCHRIVEAELGQPGKAGRPRKETDDKTLS